ncbi:hypothetical protein MIB92_12590 [Aestuariirhabdus sp. Z084]|uniref:DUF6678 family protein n=1 Tax=Aestuariirhabdus haliotis TaxID=2918751 RepID=UPI00201B3A4C|nr:DUF6678 family protein [Aestuariirhabdus haliotis]MCL6416493.1 hypothetical protein [Aestuariirhabdus haliotis]MCL6420483.1 hypothetical protein [Aestuariirhabdus haliotis]
MSFDQNHNDEIRRRFKTKAKSMSSHMSNTKWRKLFKTVAPVLRATAPWGSDVQTKCRYKLLGEDLERSGKWPEEKDLLEIYISDGVWGCPVEYQHIEWVMILLTYEINPNAKAVHNIKEVAEVLKGVAEFPIEETGNSLKILGYK